jgi:cation diffusion facilitator CzcD-associated flavoprotein CzcO
MHSSAFPGGEAWPGKSCVVVGANNSAHDICADPRAHGAQVTMLQRSSTTVVRSETLQELGWGRLFSEDAVRRGIDHGPRRHDDGLDALPRGHPAAEEHHRPGQDP